MHPARTIKLKKGQAVPNCECGTGQDEPVVHSLRLYKHVGKGAAFMHGILFKPNAERELFFCSKANTVFVRVTPGDELPEAQDADEEIAANVDDTNE